MQIDEQQVERWTNVALPLNSLERAALIGLVVMYPTLPPSDVQPDRIVGEEKCWKASQWLQSNFRSLLQQYCSLCDSVAQPISGGVKETHDWIKSLVTLIVGATGLSISAATAFAVWMLGFAVQNWCKVYGKKQLDGRGNYLIEFDFHYGGDFPPDLSEEGFPGIFSIDAFPSISEAVRDKRYPSPVHEVRIIVPARAECTFFPDDVSCSSKIIENAISKHQHSFSFSDTRTSEKADYLVDCVTVKPSGSGLAFEGKPKQ